MKLFNLVFVFLFCSFGNFTCIVAEHDSDLREVEGFKKFILLF